MGHRPNVWQCGGRGPSIELLRQNRLPLIPPDKWLQTARPPSYPRQAPVLYRLAAITISMIGEGTVAAQAIFHMIVIAFFFLLGPGEYTAPNDETATFELQNVILYVGNVQHPSTAIPLHLPPLASLATLEFTNQKNGVEGEIIGHGPSGDGFICPVDAVRARVRHLWENNAPLNTPLCAYYQANGTIKYVTSRDITTTLRAVVSQLGPAALGFLGQRTIPPRRRRHGLVMRPR
jgi:hypothetical protein